MHSGNKLPPVMIRPIMMRRMTIIDEGWELHQAKPSSLTMKALNQISKSPFTRKIEGVKLPWRFHLPTFTIYNGRMDPMEHVSQFNQRMAVYSKDETLICKVFPSSLGPVAMRWFNDLRVNSINSFKELTRAFGSHFITVKCTPP